MPRNAASSLVDSLRREILDGRLQPGDRLDEVSFGARYQVSRNTLREAFRVLGQDHLVVHAPNRGVFVRQLTVKEVGDLYQARRVIECGALREVVVRRSGAGMLSRSELAAFEANWRSGLRAVSDAVECGLTAADDDDWNRVGSCNNDFHLALTGLADNHVIDRTMRHILTEMRLLFVIVAPAREVHERYLHQNVHVSKLLLEGEVEAATVALEKYLIAAEDHLRGVYAQRLEQAEAATGT